MRVPLVVSLLMVVIITISVSAQDVPTPANFGEVCELATCASRDDFWQPTPLPTEVVNYGEILLGSQGTDRIILVPIDTPLHERVAIWFAFRLREEWEEYLCKLRIVATGEIPYSGC